MDKVAEIRRLYSRASPATIQRDFERAIRLLKSIPTETERERAAVYMEGLAEMRKEWRHTAKRKAPNTQRTTPP